MTPEQSRRILLGVALGFAVTAAAGCSDDDDKGSDKVSTSTGGKTTKASGGSAGQSASESGGTNDTGAGGSVVSGGTGPDVAGAAGAPGAGTAGMNTAGTAGAGPATTLYLVGDSTVAAFNDPYYYPRYGYGTQIGNYLTENIGVRNLAVSGRSSKSFIDPADNDNYAILKGSLKAGDYLIIGFGHNDEKADPSLYTNPNTDVSDPASFKYYLYTYYIQLAKDKGATPILTTPIVRRDAAGVYSGAKAHVTTDVVAGTTTYAGGDYPQAIRDLGAFYGVTVIDNTALTMALGKEIFATSGAAGTANLQAWVTDAASSVDDTHTNIYGGSYYAYLIADAVTKTDCSLKQFVRTGITPPDLSILTRNPNWVPIAYTPPVKGTIWTTTDPWIGSVFGDVGGVSKITDGTSYGIAETSVDPLTVLMRSGTDIGAVGKISSTADGIAFYFQQLPIEKDFTFSATANVKSITYNNSQVGFGLMVRDAAWVDVFNPSTLGSWVASGTLKGNAPASAWSSFIRDTSASTQLSGTTVSSASVVPAAGTVLPLSITKQGSRYTCTYGTEAPKTYTLDLNTIDSAYVYAGLFTARMCQVEYTDIKLTIAN